jgi:hypothetical protein
MRRQHDTKKVPVDSWKNVESDGWWVEARRQRDEERRKDRGF